MDSGNRFVCFACFVLVCVIITGIFSLSEAYAENGRRMNKTRKNKPTNGEKLYLRQVSEILASDLEVEDMDSLLSLEKRLQAETTENVLNRKIISMIGTPYRFGGAGNKGIDCSAFVKKVFVSLHITLPRTAREQYTLGKVVPSKELRKGDLLFFRTYAPYASHVGIYLGNKLMVHASSRDRSVTISAMDTPYFRSRYLGARRIDNYSRQQSSQPEIGELLTS